MSDAARTVRERYDLRSRCACRTRLVDLLRDRPLPHRHQGRVREKVSAVPVRPHRRLGRAVNSCPRPCTSGPADSEIMTVEGLERRGEPGRPGAVYSPAPLRGAGCGSCTPGMLMSATASPWRRRTRPIRRFARPHCWEPLPTYRHELFVEAILDAVRRQPFHQHPTGRYSLSSRGGTPRDPMSDMDSPGPGGTSTSLGAPCGPRSPDSSVPGRSKIRSRMRMNGRLCLDSRPDRRPDRASRAEFRPLGCRARSAVPDPPRR